MILERISQTDVTLVLDVGTTRTRCWATIGGNIRSQEAIDVGVRSTVNGASTAALKEGVRSVIFKALRRGGFSEADVVAVFALGMVTSEIGLLELPHCLPPAGVIELANNVRSVRYPEILDVPFCFIPGVKNPPRSTADETLQTLDFMRGEETQVVGVIETLRLGTPTNILFLTSHSKIVAVDSQSRIYSSLTTLSGQLYNAVISSTSISHSLEGGKQENASYDTYWLEKGAALAREWGLLRGLLYPRLVDVLLETTTAQRAALLEGALIESDLEAFRGAKRVGINLGNGLILVGNTRRSEAYRHMLTRSGLVEDDSVVILPDKDVPTVTVRGALRIADAFLRGRSK